MWMCCANIYSSSIIATMAGTLYLVFHVVNSSLHFKGVSKLSQILNLNFTSHFWFAPFIDFHVFYTEVE